MMALRTCNVEKILQFESDSKTNSFSDTKIVQSDERTIQSCSSKAVNKVAGNL